MTVIQTMLNTIISAQKHHVLYNSGVLIIGTKYINVEYSLTMRVPVHNNTDTKHTIINKQILQNNMNTG
jgi:hypothetical protein